MRPKTPRWHITLHSKGFSLARGARPTDVYSVILHREANELNETFPGLLVLNVHLNAKSWKDKTGAIDPQVYGIAANNNILVARTEDLLFFWNSIVEKRHTQEELLSYILNENGWMEVQEDGSVEIHRAHAS